MVFTDNASAECREGIVTLGKLNKSQAVGEERGRTYISGYQGSIIRGKCGRGVLRDDRIVYKVGQPSTIISFSRFISLSRFD